MIVAVTGHRPPKLGGYWVPNPIYNAVKAGLLRKFRELQPTVVLTGMALGTDQWAAEVCRDNAIPYDAIVPFHGFESQWPDASKAQYHRLLAGARTTHVVTDTSTYSGGLLQRRNQWLVDHSVVLVGVWNGSSGGTSNCITYARGRGKNIVLVDLPDAIWAAAAEQEQIHTGRVAARQMREMPMPPPTAPTFRRRPRFTSGGQVVDQNNVTINEDDLRSIYRQILESDPTPEPAPGSSAAAIRSAMRNPEVQAHLEQGLLMNILHHTRDTPAEPPDIPSPIKGDKQATPRKTGRIIDLDD
jgi:uncharacterized phage-like protein YoqJ